MCIKKKMNIKGYVLIEIILAFAIAFGLAYFITNLTIKLKNKNDDLMVETLVTTDQTIVTNKLMDYAIFYGKEFDCTKLTYEGNTIKYNDEIVGIVNEYTKIDADSARENCLVKDGKITIDIPLIVEQQKGKDYSIKLEYKYEIGDMIKPILSAKLNGSDCTSRNLQLEAHDEGSGVNHIELIVKKYNDESSQYELVHDKSNDSIIPVKGSYEVILSGYEEGKYQFDIVAYDNADNDSIPATVMYEKTVGISDDMFDYEGGNYEIKDGKLRLLSSGTLKMNCSLQTDIFLVGGGGGGGGTKNATHNATGNHQGGGGGGYTTTVTNKNLSQNGSYAATIGAGGARAKSGGNTIFVYNSTSFAAGGGSPGQTTYSSDTEDSDGCYWPACKFASGNGGNGGSGGGGAGGHQSEQPGVGGSDGSAGKEGIMSFYNGATTKPGGGSGCATNKGCKINGQICTNTREFCETSGELYAGGGGGEANTSNGTVDKCGKGGAGGGGGYIGSKTYGSGSECYANANGTANTGGGGSGVAGTGGSGIIVIRIAK